MRRLLLFFVLCCVQFANSSDIEVKHYQHQERYRYGANVLDLALSKLNLPYRIVAPDKQVMNEARGELMVINGAIDVQWMITTDERESKMIPVKIPLYQGILGTRLLLGKHDRLEELSSTRNLDDLGKYVGGHGKHWKDLSIYAANGLRVSAHVKYESLFKLLDLGRFDYFHRGLNEIWDEASRYSESLGIVDKVMLFYPIPVYFFITPKRPQLAGLLEKGLQLASEDGSLKTLFLKFNGEFIEKADLGSRHLIILKNPDLPLDAPALDTRWWMPESLQAQIKAAGY